MESAVEASKAGHAGRIRSRAAAHLADDRRRAPRMRDSGGLSLYIRPVPTIHREGPYGFFFFSNEGLEPAHVHI